MLRGDILAYAAGGDLKAQMAGSDDRPAICALSILASQRIPSA
jgi:hypothetical protein